MMLWGQFMFTVEEKLKWEPYILVTAILGSCVSVCGFLGTISESDLLIYSLEITPYSKHRTPQNCIIWCPSSCAYEVVQGMAVTEALLMAFSSAFPTLLIIIATCPAMGNNGAFYLKNKTRHNFSTDDTFLAVVLKAHSFISHYLQLEGVFLTCWSHCMCMLLGYFWRGDHICTLLNELGIYDLLFPTLMPSPVWIMKWKKTSEV